MVSAHGRTIRRTAMALAEPVSSVGRWAVPSTQNAERKARHRPVVDDPPNDYMNTHNQK